LSFGVVSVLVPLCVIQPALGAGYFAANTPAPVKSCLRSLATHCVFGCGLYLAALGRVARRLGALLSANGGAASAWV
jgi:hypothetical protein